MKVLHLDSSVLGQYSVSRQLGAQLVEQLQAQHGAALELVYHDLAANPLAHLDGEILQAAGLAPEQRSARQQQEYALSQQLIAELLQADALIIAAPLYNFGIPSQLKAWVDRVAVAGVTFRYTENGPQGLVNNKPVWLISSRGGVYSEGPAAALEHQESYLKTVLGFIGLTDVRVVRAEGLNLGEAARAKGLEMAKQETHQSLAA